MARHDIDRGWGLDARPWGWLAVDNRRQVPANGQCLRYFDTRQGMEHGAHSVSHRPRGLRRGSSQVPLRRPASHHHASPLRQSKPITQANYKGVSRFVTLTVCCTFFPALFPQFTASPSPSAHPAASAPPP